MLGRDIGFGAAAIVCLFTLSANAEEGETRSHSVIIMASPSVLPVGARCRIELHPESMTGSQELDRIPYVKRSFKNTGVVAVLYEGTIKKITKDKVLFTAVRKGWDIDDDTRQLSHIPYVKRKFKNTGGGRQPLEENEVQVPIDRIRSITLIEEAKRKESAQSGSRRPEPNTPRK
jgi:hypothetical protein